MDPEVEIEEKIKQKMEASTSKVNEIFAKELQDELMRFTTNYDEKGVGAQLVEKTEKDNIVECSNSGVDELAEIGCSDTTECSSSFDDSDYGAESVDSLGDSKASSDFHGDAEYELDFNGFGKQYRRRKKLTSHWKSFIHPIMWRCKWAELQIKKLAAQAQKYERKLEEYSTKSTSQVIGIKSLTFPQNYEKSKVLRRKKRRKAEATTDVAAYMSHHNLFSYYGNRKFIREVACHVLKNPYSDQEVNIDEESWSNDELLWVEAVKDDKFLEHILRNIELLHSQVVKMKTRVGKVMSEQTRKFSYMDNLSSSVVHNDQMSSTPNTAGPPSTGYRMPVGTYIASQLMSDYNMGGVLLPESASENHRGVLDANGSGNHAHFAYAYGNEDDVLIDNPRVREEMRYFEEVNFHPIGMHLVLKYGLDSAHNPAPAEPILLSDDQPPPRIRSNSNVTVTPNSIVLAERDLLKDDQQSRKIHTILNLTAPAESTVMAELDFLMDDQPTPDIHSISNLANAPKSKKRRRRKGAAQ